MITIIDIGMGNLGSILNMLKYLKIKAIISSDKNDIHAAEKLLLPGVGSFDNAMNSLNKMNIVSLLEERVLDEKIPILGICLGIQLFTQKSEEGRLPGLGWMNADTVRFKIEKSSSDLKIPHMGWNLVKPARMNTLFKDMNGEMKFYFVHSYHVKCRNAEDILGTTKYGIEFVSAIQKNNIYGTQFHPEKSHKYGMKILKNFSELP